MKKKKFALSFLVLSVLVLCAAVAAAGDFDWMRDLNIRAQADRDGFRAQLESRFRVGPAQVQVVLGAVDSPADAYMVFRLGEMASRPVADVLDRYRAQEGRGWGALAKSLGIKPGSSEFHALKEGSDLPYGADRGNGRKKGRGR